MVRALARCRYGGRMREAGEIFSLGDGKDFDPSRMVRLMPGTTPPHPTLSPALGSDSRNRGAHSRAANRPPVSAEHDPLSPTQEQK